MLTARRSMYVVRLDNASTRIIDITPRWRPTVTIPLVRRVNAIDDARLKYALDMYGVTVSAKHRPSARNVIAVLGNLALGQRDRGDGEYADDSREQIMAATRLSLGVVTDVLAFAKWSNVAQTLRGGHRGQTTRRHINPDLLPIIPKSIPTHTDVQSVGNRVGISKNEKSNRVDQGSGEASSRHPKSITNTTKSGTDVAGLNGATSEPTSNEIEQVGDRVESEPLEPVANELMSRSAQITSKYNKG